MGIAAVFVGEREEGRYFAGAGFAGIWRSGSHCGEGEAVADACFFDRMVGLTRRVRDTWHSGFVYGRKYGIPSSREEILCNLSTKVHK